MKKLNKKQALAYDEWLDKVRYTGFRLGYLKKEEVMDMDAWADYYKEGLTPEQAFIEDLSYTD